jgi:DNA-binding transcriptional ArsR family regulator
VGNVGLALRAGSPRAKSLRSETAGSSRRIDEQVLVTRSGHAGGHERAARVHCTGRVTIATLRSRPPRSGRARLSRPQSPPANTGSRNAASLDTEPDDVYLIVRLINHPIKYMADQLSATFQALADPTRRAILARLAEGDATVSELARPFTVSLPAISRHLKVLERAGLISRDRSAQYRPSSLRAERLDEATTWMVTCREIWESRMHRLDEYLLQIQKGQANE